MAKSQHLSHVAMSVPEATFTDAWRTRVLDFYGRVFGWTEMESLRLPDRLTIAVGVSYINVRARSDAPNYRGYEHFGVAFTSKDELEQAWARANVDDPDVKLEPLEQSPSGFASFRLHYLLPLTVEPQYFPTPDA
jgi:hypothetical protein